MKEEKEIMPQESKVEQVSCCLSLDNAIISMPIRKKISHYCLKGKRNFLKSLTQLETISLNISSEIILKFNRTIKMKKAMRMKNDKKKMQKKDKRNCGHQHRLN